MIPWTIKKTIHCYKLLQTYLKETEEETVRNKGPHSPTDKYSTSLKIKTMQIRRV